MPAFQLEPDGAGTYNEWTLVGSGTPLSAIQDDVDANYLRALTSGNRTSFTCGDLPSYAESVLYVNHFARMIQVAGGTDTCYARLRYGGVNSDVLQNLPADSTWHNYSTAFANCPGSTGWTPAQVNGTEIGEYAATVGATALGWTRSHLDGWYVTGGGGYMLMNSLLLPLVGAALTLAQFRAALEIVARANFRGHRGFSRDEVAEAWRFFQAERRRRYSLPLAA